MRGYVEESLVVVARRELRRAARRYVAYDILLGETDNASKAEAELVEAARNMVAVLEEETAPKRARKRASR